MMVNDFLEKIDFVLDELKNKSHKEAFAKNMEHLELEDKKFSEWVMTYLAWSELGSEKDVANYYWNLEDENYIDPLEGVDNES